MAVAPKGFLDASRLHMVNGEYYNLSSFYHPGGRLVLEQSVGLDITASVESHHFTDAPWKVMAKYKVDEQVVRGTIRQEQYSFKPQGLFAVCKRKVVAVLGPDVRAAPSSEYKVKVLGTVVLWVASWVYCCLSPLWMPALLFCAGTRMVLTGIGHEAIHGRLQSSLWHLFDWCIFFPSELWHREHCLEHHPHCKRFELDPDETLHDCVRLNKRTPWAICHLPQVLSQFLISLIIGVAGYVEHHLVGRRVPLLSGVVLFVTQFLPFLIHPEGFWTALQVHCWVVMLANSVGLHAFHLSHINEANSDAHYEYHEGIDWGEHQLRTTTNWAANEVFSVTGMLELQVEHHLFPSLTYAQQRTVQPLVRETAREFGIPYHEHRSIFHGIFQHLRFMQTLSHKTF